MKTVVEPLEGNKVKLSVEVDEQEFAKAMDAAFRQIAREVRIPGFRPGKAPRRLLEARIGVDAAREQALRESLPEYYAQALRETDLDAIAPPEIDIKPTEETASALAFEAVVQVRPQVAIPGYGGLRVVIPHPEATDDDVDRQIDRLRNQFGELKEVDRPAKAGDHLTLSITATRTGVEEPVYQTDDELYEVGSGTIVPELDARLDGAKVGEVLEFTSPTPGGEEGDELSFRVLVKDVKEKILPDLTDEWASEASEFETVDELKADVRKRIGVVKRVQAQMALQEQAINALVELVEDEVPEPLVAGEMEQRLHNMAHRLQEQGADLAQYLEVTGTSQEELVEQLRGEATSAVKADLALRALAEAEGFEATDDDVDEQVERLAERFGRKPTELRRDLERQDALPTVRSDVRKAKALEWLVEHVEVVDDEGQPIDRSLLQPPAMDDAEGTEQAEQDEAEGTGSEA